MRKQGLTLIEALVGLLVLGILAAILFPMFARPRESDQRSPRGTCLSNLKQIGLGFKQYAQDYDDKLPPVRITSGSGPNYFPAYGWADALQPYLKSVQIFQCPAQPGFPKAASTATTTTISALDPQFTDYWFNKRLNGVLDWKLQFPSTTFLAGDGNDGTETCDARYAIAVLPDSWRTTADSPAVRHDGGANYLFADGHAKWLQPDKVTTNPAGDSNYSFLPGPYARALKNH